MSTETTITDHSKQIDSVSPQQAGTTVLDVEIVAPDDVFQPKFGWYVAIRPVFDVIVGLILLICLTPAIIVAALAVKVTSPGPAFYRQTRLGRNGRKFTMTKIRTMVNDAEAGTGPVWAAADDPRITRLGRFLRNTHIDEFPQLVNVVLGQMSLIGPRPERPEIAQSLKWDIPHFDQRLQVRPGITGLAQLTLPADSDIDGVRKKFLSDTYYIRYMNPWLDARICMSTVWYLLKASWWGLIQFISLPCPVRVEQQLGCDCNVETLRLISGCGDCEITSPAHANPAAREMSF